MKNIMRFFAVMVMALSLVGVSFAGGTDVDVKTKQGQEQGQGQSQTAGVNYAPVSKGNVGGWLHPGGVQELSPPNFPFMKYQRQVNDLPSPIIMKIISKNTPESFSTFESEIAALNGERFLGKLRDNVRLRPTIIKKFPAAQEIYLVEDLPAGANVTPIGFLAGDSVLDKKYLVYRQELTMIITDKARKTYGANIAVWVPEGDYFRSMLMSGSYGFGLSGVLGQLILGGGNPWALAGAPQANMQNGNNVMYGDTGTVYALFHAENPDEVLNPQPPPPPAEVNKPEPPKCDPDKIRAEIEDLREQISRCKNWGMNNLRLRFLLGNAYVNLAVCTGENGYFTNAIEEGYKLAEKNYLNGKDIKANQAEADQIIYKVYWNWAAVIRERDGRDAEIAFAQDKGMVTMPSGIGEIKR